MEKRKHFVGLAIIVATAVIFGMTFPLHAADKLLCGSTATTSSHYVYTVSAGKAINTMSGDKVNVTVVATGGAVDNLERINRGQLNMGIGTWATFYQAYNGIGKYKGKARPKMRALWLYSSNTQNYVVRADSGIKDLEGLTDKKFCPGLRGSATEQLVQQLLETIAVKPDYFRASLADAVAAVKDNRIAGYVKAGAGLDLDGTTKELKAFTKIRLLHWPPDKAAKVQNTMPFVSFVDVPEGTIPGIPAYTTVVQAIGIICYDDSLTNDQAYYIVKGICEGKKYQEAAYPAMKGFDIPGMTMKLTKFPLHPGAIRYYKEIGVKVPAHLIPPEAK
ncbi:MAG: TAXI family TRAP transporter solute-binding subunit [Deltaproteobacteria bacterium]|nr:TAXI family TRAP transporter solute-binding subunit [Deltaproteobacteria bacterium]